jgi:hypothetical protein
VGGKELAPLLLFLIWFFVSWAQTPLPLIHPAGSIFGGAERGEGQNQGGDDWPVYVLVMRRTFGALHLRLMCHMQVEFRI